MTFSDSEIPPVPPLVAEQIILYCLQRSFNGYMRFEHLLRHVRENHGLEIISDEAVREFLERMIVQGIVQKVDFDGHPSYRLCNGYKFEHEPISKPVTLEQLPKSIQKAVTREHKTNGFIREAQEKLAEIEREANVAIVNIAPVRALPKEGYFSFEWGGTSRKSTPIVIDAAPTDFDWDRALDLDYLRERAERKSRS